VQRCWSRNGDAQPSKEPEEGRRPGGPRGAPSPTLHYNVVLAVGLQPVVEKMDRTWRAPAMSSGRGARVGQRKRQGRRGASAGSRKMLWWGGGSERRRRCR
jgi:hypothetical protein